jgi:hypothetical protein
MSLIVEENNFDELSPDTLGDGGIREANGKHASESAADDGKHDGPAAGDDAKNDGWRWLSDRDRR